MSDIETAPANVGTSSFKEDVIAALRATPKRIPSKYFYDERGAKLFEEITELPEYYLTRTEIRIFEHCLPEIANQLKHLMPFTLVEFGTGAGTKTEMLLNALRTAQAMPERFVSIDISEEQLYESARALEARFPGLCVEPRAADFSDRASLADALATLRAPRAATPVYFFPGSSIGNFTPTEATEFLAALPKPATLILGVDRAKDKRRLLDAYNDAKGVTAAFNLNLIHRMQRELEARVESDAFRHVACFNEPESRIEMHIEATRQTTIQIEEMRFALLPGERILTEFSYKYTDPMLRRLLVSAGFQLRNLWTDRERLFAVCLCASE